MPGRDSYGGGVTTVTSLPPANASNRGRVIVLFAGIGSADGMYICLKSATETYSWKSITTG